MFKCLNKYLKFLICCLTLIKVLLLFEIKKKKIQKALTEKKKYFFNLVWKKNCWDIGGKSSSFVSEPFGSQMRNVAMSYKQLTFLTIFNPITNTFIEIKTL